MRTPPSWDEYFMRLAVEAADRSKNPGDRFGAVVVTDRHELVSTGFNGPPPDMDDETLPWRPPESLVWHFHAEENAIYFALMSRGWMALKGCTMYVTGRPCNKCALWIARSGIDELVIGGQVATMNTNEMWETSQKILAKRRPPVVWRRCM